MKHTHLMITALILMIAAIGIASAANPYADANAQWTAEKMNIGNMSVVTVGDNQFTHYNAYPSPVNGMKVSDMVQDPPALTFSRPLVASDVMAPNDSFLMNDDHKQNGWSVGFVDASMRIHDFQNVYLHIEPDDYPLAYSHFQYDTVALKTWIWNLQDIPADAR